MASADDINSLLAQRSLDRIGTQRGQLKFSPKSPVANKAFS